MGGISREVGAGGPCSWIGRVCGRGVQARVPCGSDGEYTSVGHQHCRADFAAAAGDEAVPRRGVGRADPAIARSHVLLCVWSVIDAHGEHRAVRQQRPALFRGRALFGGTGAPMPSRRVEYRCVAAVDIADQHPAVGQHGRWSVPDTRPATRRRNTRPRVRDGIVDFSREELNILAAVVLATGDEHAPVSKHS